tara:strand:- start:363 stop:473 length:111 start_codon:yes stop_codon:yes gene_type:complete
MTSMLLTLNNFLQEEGFSLKKKKGVLKQQLPFYTSS